MLKQLRKVYELSPAKLVASLRRILGVGPPMRLVKPPTLEFLRSDAYQERMMRYVPCTGDYGLYEASTYTRSYVHRHKTCLAELGVFRWRGAQEHLEEILALVSEGKVVVDVGGGGCPLGLSSVVIDRLPKDAAGNAVRFNSMQEIGKPIDVVFCCHMLEHVENLDEVLAEIKGAMAPDASLIVFVPSYTNEGWRAGEHSNRRFGGHVWTFGLRDDPLPGDLHNYRPIDDVLREHFCVETELLQIAI